MRILIIEDDENKREKVTAFIEGTLQPVHIDAARSLQGALRMLTRQSYELVILDMSMPTFDIGPDEHGGRFQQFGGREILRQMERRKIHLPFVVLTQFDRFEEGDEVVTLEALDSQLRRSHPSAYMGSVYYNVTQERWKEELMDFMINAAKE